MQILSSHTIPTLQYRPSKLFLYLQIVAILFVILLTHNVTAQNNTSEFTTIITQADQAFAAKDYANSLMLYQKAYRLKPSDTKTIGKIEEINKIFENSPQLKSQLIEDIVIKAEELLSKKNYASAKTEYQKALALDPSAQFPKDRLTEIGRVYTDPADQMYFDNAVTDGDKQLLSGNYTSAIQAYETALTVKPDSKPVKDKIANTRKLKLEAEARENQSAVIIAAADKLAASGKQAEAKTEYEKALALTPNNIALQQKIKEINQLQEAKNAKQQAFDKTIEEADNFYINRDFANARVRYQAALAIKPDARYPKEMIQKTSTGESQIQSEKERYDAAIASAENFLKNKDYTLAKEGYASALAINPSESYPKTKITEIEKLVATIEANDKAYQTAIKNGDEALLEKKYEIALKHYNSAIAIKPAETYPTNKVNEINALVASEKNTLASYQMAISEGDRLFKAARYNESINEYEKAKSLKPTETYPAERVLEASKKIAELQSKDENYTTAIQRGDNLYQQQDWENALVAYKEASSIKSNEKYPKDKIEEVSKLWAKQKSDSENYAKFVALGDSEYAVKKLNEALSAYTEALKYKQDAEHPKNRLAEINQTLSLQKETEANYSKAISEADKNNEAKEYEKALENYALASRIKPSETYPKTQTEKINQLLAAARSNEENYSALLKTGDDNFAAKKYTDAIVAYNSALQLKKNETYPSAQISKANQLLDEQKKLNNNYQSEISSADILFNTSKFAESIDAYTKALSIKPDEKYPSDKIQEAKTQLAQLKKKQEEYERAIAEGDALFAKKELDRALNAYSEASTIKPNESYPKQKVAEITQILEKDLADNQAYANAIAKADAAFDQKKWDEALVSYQKAKSVKPQDSYSENRIVLTNNAMVEQRKADNDYLTEIASADQLFENKKYAESILIYKKAKNIKPAELYAPQQIAEAEKQISLLEQQQKEYNACITEAEKQYQLKDWDAALQQYEKASLLKPNEEIPKQKIGELKQTIAKEKGINQQYTEAIALADELFGNKKYREALEPYQRASTIKSLEKYPQDQLTKINQLLAEQKKQDEDFDALITTADQQFKSGKLTEARATCAEALKIKKDEKQALELLTRIDEGIAKVKADNDNYNKAIEQANSLLASGELSGAIPYFEQALAIKPDEKLPAEKIQNIRAELKKTDELYQSLISEADAQLAAEKFQEALNLYQKASDTKKNEGYPKQKVQDINNLLAERKEEQLKMYNSFVAEADRYFASNDYFSAKTEYTKASGIKPDETYPKQKLIEVNALIKQIEETRQAEYRKAVGEADKLYNSKIYDQAIEAYEAVLKLNYPDPYPGNQIAKIRKYLDDHSIQDLNSQLMQIAEGSEKKFTFNVIEPRLRKNNYILLKARSTGSVAPKVFLNYGRDGVKNGGIVLRGLDKKEISDYLIRISVQDKWYREDNNWISLSVETGDLEITRVQIAAGE